GDGHARPRRGAARRAQGQGPCQAASAPAQRFRRTTAQTSPTGPRPILTDSVEVLNTLAPRLVRTAVRAGAAARAVEGGNRRTSLLRYEGWRAREAGRKDGENPDAEPAQRVARVGTDPRDRRARRGARLRRPGRDRCLRGR